MEKFVSGAASVICGSILIKGMKNIEELRKAVNLIYKTKDVLHSYASEYAKEPLYLYGTLCNIKILLLKERYGILIKLHHIIGDAWTLSLICSQFNAILSGKIPSAYSYIQYLDKEKCYMKSSRTCIIYKKT